MGEETAKAACTPGRPQSVLCYTGVADSISGKGEFPQPLLTARERRFPSSLVGQALSVSLQCETATGCVALCPLLPPLIPPTHCTGSPDLSRCALLAINLWDTELLHDLVTLEKPWQIWSIFQMSLSAPTFEQAAKSLCGIARSRP